MKFRESLEKQRRHTGKSGIMAQGFPHLFCFICRASFEWGVRP